MQILAIDTASPTPSVTLLARGGVWEEVLPPDRRASEELLPAIERCLASAGAKLAECDRIAVCSGPGSFTGLRVGLATAWALDDRESRYIRAKEALAQGAALSAAAVIVVVLLRQVSVAEAKLPLLSTRHIVIVVASAITGAVLGGTLPAWWRRWRVVDPSVTLTGVPSRGAAAPSGMPDAESLGDPAVPGSRAATNGSAHRERRAG